MQKLFVGRKSKENVSENGEKMRKYLLFKDTFITLFNDSDKCMVVFLTDNGQTKAINYDDNFFYVECLIDTYHEMIIKSFKGWRNRALTKCDKEEIKAHLKKFIKFLKRQNEIDYNSMCIETREVLGL